MSSQVLSEKQLEVAQTAPLVGRPLKRKEDPRILTGHTRYVDDIKLPGMLHSAVLRSSYSHARIKRIDTSVATGSKGVRLILTAEDISKIVEPISFFDLKDGTRIKRPVLAENEVRYFGEPVAFVVADSRYEAEDALEAITVDYEPLDAIIDPGLAGRDDAPRCHQAIKKNIVMVETIESGNIEEAFSKAAKVVKLELLNQRLAPAPLEPRGSVAQFDEGSEILNLWISTQGPFQNRSDIAEIIHFPENKLHVIAPDVGGGFGAKLSTYSEEILVCISSIKLKRPVKWVESRSENLSSMTHGRGQLQRVELAATEKGRILGLKVNLIGDVGAYLSEDTADATFTIRMCPGQYLIPAYRAEAQIALTNKVPHSAYRGASRPEATYLIERAIDELSHELGIDPEEVRLRNFIPKENFPFKTVGGLTYDSGDYSMNLKRALELSKYNSWRDEQMRLREKGRLIGVGLATYVEICAFGPDFPQTASISVNQSGKVTVISGTSPHGQGHETPLAQIVADKLGIEMEDVFVTYGDTGMLPWGTFTAGSRSAALGGSAVLMCAEKIRDKMAKIASKSLEVPEEDVIFKNGGIFSRANSEKKLSFKDVASYAYQPRMLPKGMETVLYAFSSYAPISSTFPFGTHIAVVEVDKDTGCVNILDYVAVDDCGRVLNPMIVEGQVQGGIAQGLGQAMLEQVVYDEDGQLLTASFLDYQIPQAEDIPDIRSFRTETTTFANLLGIKGIGEAGTIAATPTLANAVRDALAPLGIKVNKMPFTMNYVKELIGESGRKQQ
ncbi:MAG TPA: xanthine dehydrogenase family protein molybdopterin-binding subunit [Nitrososphaerales archaeon]|nr:xanthine dehydrogenase family protein molybdopterin-binding subunit [Nitrososphaerales archaeon]